LQVASRLNDTRYVRLGQQQRRQLVADDGCGNQGGDHRQIQEMGFAEFQGRISPWRIMASYGALMRGNI
jgi:hypothetical protein